MNAIVLRGPAGAGKSTLAVAVQQALGYPTAHPGGTATSPRRHRALVARIVAELFVPRRSALTEDSRQDTR